MKLAACNLNDVDLNAYKAQTNVRRTFLGNTNYQNIAIMTDADVDGRRKPT